MTRFTCSLVRRGEVYLKLCTLLFVKVKARILTVEKSRVLRYAVLFLVDPIINLMLQRILQDIY